MKKQTSSAIVVSEFSSSDDESLKPLPEIDVEELRKILKRSNVEIEKAKPKLDKEELRKYLKDSDEESSQEQITPKRRKNVKRLKTPPIEGSPIIKPKKVISKDPPQNYLVQGDDFKKLQKKAKKLGASSLDYSKRKNYKYIIEYDNKKIHFGSANTEDYLTHKDPVRRDKYLTKAKKISKMGNLHTKFPLIQIIGLSNF